MFHLINLRTLKQFSQLLHNKNCSYQFLTEEKWDGFFTTHGPADEVLDMFYLPA